MFAADLDTILAPPSGAPAFLPPRVAVPLALWLRSDRGIWQQSGGTTVAAADGDVVGRWSDLSGNNRHAIQPTTAFKPTLRLGVINGHPVIRGDGVDDCLVAALGTALSQPTTLFIVGKIPATSGPYLLDGTMGTARRAVFRSSAANLQMNAGAGSLDFAVDAGFHALTWLSNGGSSVSRRDGVQTDSGDNGVQAVDGLTLFARFSFQNFSASDMAELLLYAGALDAGQIAQVEEYLGDRYGLF